MQFLKVFLSSLTKKFKRQDSMETAESAIVHLPVPLLNPEELREFAQRLRETQLWCDMKAGTGNAQKVFRSQDLKPPTLDLPGHTFDSVKFEDMRDTVTQLSIRRRELLKMNPGVSPTPKAAQGQLLACFYDDSVYDTAAESVSSLFIDGSDRPPWDTWIWCHNFPYMIRDERRDSPAIISWVPARFVEPDVNSAIDDNPVHVLRWLLDEENEFTNQLREHQLL